MIAMAGSGDSNVTSRHVKVGIIGGSGLEDPDVMEERTEKYVTTPYGKPSDALIIGKIKGVDCVLLSRHGRRHTISPSAVNYRANIWALKQEGCTVVIATAACGSLQEHVAPGEFVVIDQFLDFTKRREMTFYDGAPTSPVGVCHIPMAQPFCSHIRQVLTECLKELQIPSHNEGTYVTVEGPRFSSKAESFVFKSYGATIVGMTLVPEVVLAKEIALPYAALGLVTDYDCWKDDDCEHVSVDLVTKQMLANAKNAKLVFMNVIPRIAAKNWEPILQHYQEMVRVAVMLP